MTPLLPPLATPFTMVGLYMVVAQPNIFDSTKHTNYSTFFLNENKVVVCRNFVKSLLERSSFSSDIPLLAINYLFFLVVVKFCVAFITS